MASGDAATKPQQQNDDEENKRTLVQRLISVGVAGGVVALYYAGYPKVAEMHSGCTRILFAIRWQLPCVVASFIDFWRVIKSRRAVSAFVPTNEDTEKQVEIPKRIMANGMEQAFFHTTSQLMLSIYLNESQMHIIPIISGLYFVGRILYARGYPSTKRGLGFRMTIAPSVLTTLFVLYKFVRAGNGIVEF